MPLFYLTILSITQGLTEFLPISSSAHLVLVAKFFNISGRSLTLDVAMHVGTLGAVLLYLWREVAFMLQGVIEVLMGRRSSGAKLFLFLIVGTIPLSMFGYAINYFFPEGITNIKVIAWMTLIFGIFLLAADKIGMTVRRIEHLKYIDVIFISIAQILALIPGTSRSGICMTAARILGMERGAAARFSMLLGIPAILGAGSLKGFELWKFGDIALTRDAYIGVVLSFIVALLSISLMMFWLRRANFTPFAIYRVLLGFVLLEFSYGWSR